MSGRNAFLLQRSRWPVRTELKPTIWPSISATVSQQAKDPAAALAEYERGVRALQKEFPKQPQVYGMLLDVASGADNDKARALAKEGIDVEVVDPRTLIPLDKDTILASVEKTHRALVVTEETRTGSSAAEIAATIAEEGFDFLDAPVVRLGAPDIPLPFSSQLQQELIGSDLVERHHRGMAEGGVGLVGHAAEVGIGDFTGGKGLDDVDGDFPIGPAEEACDGVLRELRPDLGHVKAAVAGQPREHDLDEIECRGLAPG